MNASELAYTLTILLTKTSILLLYLRIFSPTPSLRLAIHITLWANVAFYVIGFFLELFMCHPRESIWNPWIENWKCIDQGAAELASAIFNTVSDFTILGLPISAIPKLNIKREKKAALMVVFATGLLYVTLPTLLMLYLALRQRMYHQPDKDRLRRSLDQEWRRPTVEGLSTRTLLVRPSLSSFGGLTWLTATGTSKSPLGSFAAACLPCRLSTATSAIDITKRPHSKA